MDVRLHDSAAEFAAIAENLYRRDPIGHTVEPAVALLARTHSELSAVRGPNATAAAFASAWQRHTGAGPEVRTGERLHRLGDLGYGSAVTAAASRTATAMGADEVVLFTDIANPVSNAIYRRIGFRPVSDWLVIGFATTV